MKNEKACTTVLVGKNATIDGSTMAARNDDTFHTITPQRFTVYPAVSNRHETLTSGQNGFSAELPESGYRFMGTPNVDVAKEGVYDENGFNEKNVGMSATESVYANERALAFDPLISNGVAEDTIMAMVHPFIDSAKDGVSYLGNVIAKYGSAEGNGVFFTDNNDVWYMEIVTGHHWVAQRIPDDAYATTGNRVAIQQVDFDDPDNFMWSDGIQDYVNDHHLNPDKDGWSFRHIFGTATEFDQHYNTPRQWYAHKILNPGVAMDPEDFDLPFIQYTDKKISLEDIEYILGSHYNGTPFDPLGHGTYEEKHRYRPISLARTQNSHILQVRNDIANPDASTIMWLCFGVPSFTPYVPFFGNISETDPSYENTPLELDTDLTSAYWMYRELSMLVESHHSHFVQSDLDYLKAAREYQYRFVNETLVESKNFSGERLTKFLTDKNKEMVATREE